jgi:hypothetical protein
MQDMYQANPLANCGGKRIEYIDCGVKPSPQSLITPPRLLKLVDLLLKYGQNGRRRVAPLELARERMSKKILLRIYFVCLECFFEYDIEIGRGRCRCGILGHRARRGQLTLDRIRKRW